MEGKRYKDLYEKAMNFLKSESYDLDEYEDIIHNLAMAGPNDKKNNVVALLCIYLQYLCFNYKLDSPYSDNSELREKHPYTSEELSNVMQSLKGNLEMENNLIETIERLAKDIYDIAKERHWCI